MILQKFNGDTHTKEALIEFMSDTIDREALSRMYEGKDVSHIKDAKELLIKCFQDLEEEFKIKDKLKEVVNESR
jgi:hypothetical protein